MTIEARDPGHAQHRVIAVFYPTLPTVPGVEGPAEDTVGGGAEGDWEVEEPVEDPGPPGG